MTDLLVRTDRSDLSITFHMSAFITNWEAARNTFMACIKDRFRDLTNPRPGDLSAASPAGLGEVWCRYRIFGGSSTIVLQSESLALTFPNMLDTDSPIIIEIVRRASELLLPMLGGYERQSHTTISNYHAEVIDGLSSEYLACHGSRKIKDAADVHSTIEYRPTIGFTLRSHGGRRVLRRTIEQSLILENGLFITDYTHVSMPELTTFSEEMSWARHTVSLANSAAGIVYKKDEEDEDASA